MPQKKKKHHTEIPFCSHIHQHAGIFPRKKRQQVNHRLETLLAYKGSWIKTMAGAWHRYDLGIRRYVVNLINYKSEIVLTCAGREEGKKCDPVYKKKRALVGDGEYGDSKVWNYCLVRVKRSGTPGASGRLAVCRGASATPPFSYLSAVQEFDLVSEELETNTLPAEALPLLH